jgi:hypothetical protein
MINDATRLVSLWALAASVVAGLLAIVLGWMALLPKASSGAPAPRSRPVRGASTVASSRGRSPRLPDDAHG